MLNEIELLSIVALYIIATVAAYMDAVCGVVAYVCVTALLMFTLFIDWKKQERKEA